jgi:hypothetical protein
MALMVLAAMATAGVPAQAAGEMHYGLGYFRPEAPVGGRVWLNDQLAVDFGVGVANREVGYMDGATTATEKKTSFTVDAGLPYVLAGDESTKFFARPGVTFASNPVWDAAEDDWANSTEFWVAGSLGAEHWFGQHFSLSAGHGLLFKSMDPGTKESESASEFTTEALGIASLGFHFYFN